VYKVHDDNVFCVKPIFNFDYNTTKAIHPVYAVILNNKQFSVLPITLKMKEKYSSEEVRPRTVHTQDHTWTTRIEFAFFAHRRGSL